MRLLILFLPLFLFAQTTGGSGHANDWTIPGNLDVTGYITYNSAHGGMYLNANTTDQLITTVAIDVGIVNYTSGHEDGFTFEAGEVGTFTGTADNGGDITFTCGGAHTMDVGDYVVINQTSTNGTEVHTGHYPVTADGGTTFDVTIDAHDASETGVWQSPSQLKLTKSGISAIEFDISWNQSVRRVANNGATDVDWKVFKNGTEIAPLHVRRSLTNTPSADGFGSIGAFGHASLTTNDILYMTVAEEDQTDDLEFMYGNFHISN